MADRRYAILGKSYLMQIITQTIRRFLKRNGVIALRVTPEAPPSTAEFLHELAATDTIPRSVVCFDHDLQIQSEVLAAFTAGRVTFDTPYLSAAPQPPALIAGKAASTAVPLPLLVEIDGDLCDLAQLESAAPWIKEADVLMVRCSLGHFWAGQGDLCATVASLASQNYFLFDVIDYGRPQFLKGPVGRVILIFCRAAVSTRLAPRFPHRKPRVAEAMGYLSAPILRSNGLRILADRGLMGFSGGVFNPGAIRDGTDTLLVARAETVPWPLQRSRNVDYLSAARPLLITVSDELAVRDTCELDAAGIAPATETRMEDFRLLRFGGQLLASHSVITVSGRGAEPGRELQVRDIRNRVGLSRVDPRNRTLTFLGVATSDRPPATNEKNWTMFVHDDRLYAIYSFQPYCVLCATEWPKLTFATVFERQLDLPFLDVGAGFVRNSINPIDYDENHLLHVVHQVRRVQNYLFWAVLIEKKSLRPVKISSRPLARNWSSARASIIYLCSAVARARDVIFFAGLDDSSTACWRIDRSALDAEWRPIAD